MATKTKQFIPCTLRQLPEDRLDEAVSVAAAHNPTNLPFLELSIALLPGISKPDRLAFLTQRYWGPAGAANLGVAFLDGAAPTLRERTLEHANRWGQRANVKFRESSVGQAQIRVAYRPDAGHYSYLGTDCLLVGKDEPTMNLELTVRSADSEWNRVCPHEFGHALGCPHEHLRREIVSRLHPKKTVEYFRKTYNWSEAMTRANVLTPLEERSIMGTPQTDETSIMAYQLPGVITTDGKPIPGGAGLNTTDLEFTARIYPRADVPTDILEISVHGPLSPGRYRLSPVEE